MAQSSGGRKEAERRKEGGEGGKQGSHPLDTPSEDVGLENLLPGRLCTFHVS